MARPGSLPTATAQPASLPGRYTFVHASAAQQPSSGGKPRAGRGGGGGRGSGGAANRGPQSRRIFGECKPGVAADRQVSFSGPFPDDPVTAIIGGGLGGLVCALELAKLGRRSVVFDTGEHGVGGRLATRTAADGSLPGAAPGLVFDHAAQYFTATDPAFQAMVAAWLAEGAVARWRGPVGTLRDGAFAPDASQERFVAPGGMRRLAQHLANQATKSGLVEVRRPQWVGSASHTDDGWRLVGRGRDQGVFDCVVIAHNGKCANRLAAPMGVPDVHAQLKRLKLSANWALLVAFASPVPVPGGMEGAFVAGSDVLSWAASNSAKLAPPGGAGSGRATVEAWTLFSTQQYGLANKVPQENVPPEVSARVTQEMLAAFEASLGLAPGSLPPVVFSRTQLWGAALPLNSPRVPCIWDPIGRAGVCGDWVAEGGSMQAAALSGKAMAERIDASRGRRPDDIADLALGLTTPLKPVAGEEIGQFPGSQPAVPQPADAAPRQPQRQQRARQPQRVPQQERQQGRRPAAAAAAAAAAAGRPAEPLLARPARRATS